MFKAIRLFSLLLLLCCATVSVAEEEDSAVEFVEEFAEDSLYLEEQGEATRYIFYEDSVQGKALDSTTWHTLTKDLNYGDTLDTEKKNDALKDQKPFNFPNFSINSTVTKYILYALVVAALIYLLYKIIGAAVYSRDIKITKASATFEILHDDEQLMQKDLSALLKEALQNDDFKTAIRILFIQTLQELQEQKLIAWKKEKTNRNYLSELNGKDAFVPLSAMILLYEKAWYSLHPASREDLDAFYSFRSQLLKTPTA